MLLNNIRWLNIKMRLTTFSQRLFFWFDHKLQPTLKAICNFNPWALWKWSKKILNPWKKGKQNKREIFQIHLNIFFSRIFSIKKNTNQQSFSIFFSSRYLYPAYMYIVIYSENPLRANSDQIKAYESPLWHEILMGLPNT